jgi:hypothetical protein
MPFLGAWLLLAMGLGLRARGWLSRKRREAGGARPVQGMTAWRNPGRCRPSLPRHCGATLWAQAWREKTSPAPCHTERDRRGGVGRSPGRARLADRLHAHAGRVRPKPMPLLAFRLSKLDEPAPSWGGRRWRRIRPAAFAGHPVMIRLSVRSWAREQTRIGAVMRGLFWIV